MMQDIWQQFILKSWSHMHSEIPKIYNRIKEVEEMVCIHMRDFNGISDFTLRRMILVLDMHGCEDARVLISQQNDCTYSVLYFYNLSRDEVDYQEETYAKSELVFGDNFYESQVNEGLLQRKKAFLK
jgi:hypothetical protein